MARGEDGRLVYTANDAGDTIPDFACVGYDYDTGPLPSDAEVPAIVNISALGDERDAGRIQAAIDHVSSLPLQPSGFRGAVALQLSANGQQYTHAGGFSYYDEPASVYATPRAGPVDGGALLTFRGDHLHSGSAYACRVGGTPVPATHRLFPDRVQCVSPNATSAGFGGLLSLALNAQQYFAAAGVAAPGAPPAHPQTHAPSQVAAQPQPRAFQL